MARRQKLSQAKSRKNFRSGTKTQKRNTRAPIMRGGYRI